MQQKKDFSVYSVLIVILAEMHQGTEKCCCAGKNLVGIKERFSENKIERITENKKQGMEKNWMIQTFCFQYNINGFHPQKEFISIAQYLSYMHIVAILFISQKNFEADILWKSCRMKHTFKNYSWSSMQIFHFLQGKKQPRVPRSSQKKRTGHLGVVTTKFLDELAFNS